MGESFDSFDEARSVLERFFEIGAESGSFGSAQDPERWQRLTEEARGLFSEDLELVTRDGTLRGPDRFLADWEMQTRGYRMEFGDLRYLDAGDGTIVALYKLVRTAREGPDYMNTWPALVFRVREGRIVFLEGYADRAKALRDVGLDPPQAR